MFEVTTSKLVPPSPEIERGNTFFLYRHLWNPDSVLVFVHGLTGSPFDTWGNFPQLAFADPELGMADVGLFKYDSSILRWRNLRLAPERPIQDIAAELSDIVRDHLHAYRHVSFIAHSLGGLITKFALRRIIDFHRDTTPNRYSLFLVGTPNHGSAWASRIPSPALLLFSPEIACLRMFSSELEELQTFWNSRVRHDPKDNPDRVLITERAIISGLDRFVARGSGVGTLPDQYVRRVPRSHTQLAKPTGDTDDVYLYVKATLRNTYAAAPPDDELRQRLPTELEDIAPEFLVKLHQAQLDSQNRWSFQDASLDAEETRKRVYEEARRDLDGSLDLVRPALREAWTQFPDGLVRQRIREFANWYGASMRSDEQTETELDAPGPQYLHRIIEAMHKQLGSERGTPFQRILTTILFSDLHEYTVRMRSDKDRMVRLLSVYTTAVELALSEHQGRSVKSIGEATLAQFPTPGEALRCAIAVQQTLRTLRGSLSGFDLECRIGIHAGEVFVSSGDLYGPGVTVAAKMASLATPGFVILSDRAVRELPDPVAYTFRARGKSVLSKSGEVGVFEIDPNSEANDPTVNHIVEIAGGHLTEAGPRVEPSPPSMESRYASIDNAIVRLGTTPILFRREDLLQEAVSRVESGPLPVVVFQGLPGTGKTTLLLETARALRGRFPYALAMRFAGPVAVEPAYLLEELNAFLTSLGRGVKPETLQQQDQHRTLDSLLLQLTDLPVLVLLEHLDVLSVEWRGRLLSGLVAASACRVVATARERPVDATRAHMLPVPPLSDQETVAFVTEYKRALELDLDPDSLIQQIPSAIRSHPQALAALLTNLVDLPLDLLVAQGVPEDARAATRLVQRIIASLDQEGRTALAFVDMLADIDLGRACRGLRLAPPQGFLPSLQVLLMRSLVYRVGTTYAVPPIVGDALHEADAVGMDLVAEQLVEAWLESTRRAEEPGTDLGILATIGTGIALHLWRRNRREWVHKLMNEDFLEQLNRRGYWKEYSFLLQLGFRVAGELSDPIARRRLGFRFARKSLQLGDASAARAALAEVETLIPATPESLERAELHSHRAIICEMDRDLAASLQELSESRRIRDALGDRTGVAIVQKLIGNVQVRRKEYGQARHAFEEAIELLADDPGSKHRIDASTTLALCDLATGSLEAAESRLRGAIADCDRFHYDAGRPRAMLNLALVLERRGPTREVLELANAAATAAEGTDPGLARFAERIASRLKDQGILGPKAREFLLTTGGDLEEVNRFFKKVTEEIIVYAAG
jgi:class 3 adenylate cyclase/tetratricopeptide (TPR) repeat protein/pimeloyl-ACP methyl ester carboxylesterase/DNA polymerase III delta prime subunit